MVNEEPLIIDAHQHFWKYDAQEYAWISDQFAPLKRDFLPEELLQLLNKEKYPERSVFRPGNRKRKMSFYWTMRKLIHL